MTTAEERAVVSAQIDKTVSQRERGVWFVKVVAVIVGLLLFLEMGAFGVTNIIQQNTAHTQTIKVLAQHTKTIKTETDLLNGVKVLVQNVDSQTSPAAEKRQAMVLKAIQVYVVECQDNHGNRDSEVVHHLRVERLKPGCPNYPLVP